MPKKKYVGKHAKQAKHLKTKGKKVIPKTGKLGEIMKGNGKKFYRGGGYSY